MSLGGRVFWDGWKLHFPGCRANLLAWRKHSSEVVWKRPFVDDASFPAGYDVRAVDVADSDYEEWRQRVHDAAEGVCARVMTPRQGNPGGKQWKGVKVEHVRSLLNGNYSRTRHWIYVVQARHLKNRPRDDQIDAFAFAHDKHPHRENTLDRRLYLDVICAREHIGPKTKSGKMQNPGLGSLLLRFVENHARQHFYGYLELSALNLWLVTEYYSKKGYLEVEDPRSSSQIDRKKVYSVTPSPWEIMERERLLKECRTRHLSIDESLSDEDLRQALSDATWCGFRMTKCLRKGATDHLEKKKRPGSDTDLVLPAKKKA
jgi:hypothetical protein